MINNKCHREVFFLPFGQSLIYFKSETQMLLFVTELSKCI